MNSAADTPKGGLPHSDIHGSTPARGSPWLIAACHVLHRLLVPRHPPNALLALEILNPLQSPIELVNENRRGPLTHHAQEPSTPNIRMQTTPPHGRPRTQHTHF